MIFDEPFIFRRDHYAYHVTHVDNMPMISTLGLRPKLGERSIFADDRVKAVYFFDSIYSADSWMDLLYPEEDGYSLELLRFNLKGYKWYLTDGCNEFYLKTPVKPASVSYLRISDSFQEFVPLSIIYDALYDKKDSYSFTWNSVISYKPLVKKC